VTTEELARALAAAEHINPDRDARPWDQLTPEQQDKHRAEAQRSRALPDFLISYMEKRQAARADRVRTVLAALTGCEQALVHDAAVMGYVQGMRHPEGEPIGKDRQTIAHVIDACLAFPDLYPAINSLEAATERRETVEYFVEFQQPDGTWEQAESTTQNPALALQRLAAHRQAQPNSEYRVARRTTTIRVTTFDVPDSEEHQ